MNLTRKHALAGLAATGIVAGALAGGGMAVASTGPAHPAATPTATASAPGQYHCGKHPGTWAGHRPIAKAITTYLGVSQDQLRNQLESGKSLADVARAQGKSVSGLETTILAAVTSLINASSLNQAEKAAAIGEVHSHLGDIVNATCAPSMSPSPTGP
jgi:hypothetical protein